MKNFVSSILVCAFSFLFAVSCVRSAGINPSNSDSSVSDLGGEWQVDLQDCGKAWSDLIKEWKDNGGGLKETIYETRMQILNDSESRFAFYVRDAWREQDNSARLSEMSEWPLSNQKLSVVYIALSKASAGTEINRPGCGLDLLAPILWHEMDISKEGRANGEGGSKVARMRFSDAPNSVPWESPDAGQWAAYWLLRRVD